MKKVNLILFIIIMFFLTSVHANASEVKSININITVDGEHINFPDQKPFIEGARTLVPVRFIAEKLGAKLEWIDSTRTIIFTKDNTKIVLNVGENKALVNDKVVEFDSKAILVGNRTFVPLRFIAETLNTKTIWDEKNMTVHVISKVDDSVFEKENIAENLSTYMIDIDKTNKKFIFKDPGYNFEGYKVSEKLNPKINKQIYDLTKVLVDDEYYTYVIPFAKAGDINIDPKENKIHVAYSGNERAAINGYNFFQFIFYENAPFNLKESYSQLSKNTFSEKVQISLNLGRLWGVKPPDNGQKSSPYFENKMRSSLITLFGEKDGLDIFNFILEEYTIKRTTNQQNVYKTKKFNNIQVDYTSDTGATLMFGFTYLR